jgi:hypothetical protein
LTNKIREFRTAEEKENIEARTLCSDDIQYLLENKEDMVGIAWAFVRKDGSSGHGYSGKISSLALPLGYLNNIFFSKKNT